MFLSGRGGREKGNNMSDMLNKTKVAVCLADGTTVKGLLNIGKYQRLSDFLNSKDADPFLIVYEVSQPETADKVIIINRNQIVWAMPE